MIGTLYDRLSAATQALQREGVKADAMSIRGHPVAIRPFALCFDAAQHPGRSKAEITFELSGRIKWRDMPVYEDGKIEQRDRVWICVDQSYVIVVEVGAFPRVDDDCPILFRVAAANAIRSISPRSAP